MEYLDIVDTDDQVIGKASRDDIYLKQLCHRVAHVVIFNTAGEMVLQKRSSSVSFCPNYWATAAGGHVQAGESYEQAALREYQEELGTTSALTWRGKDLYTDTRPNKFLGSFESRFNGPFPHDPEVVTEVRAFPLAIIRQMIEQGELFHPELLFLFKRYYL